jgi:hydroxymethylpyrimidine/phosphomethylpyrimidine kinase
MERAAEMMLGLGAQSVLVKGGDVESDEATDLLLDLEGAVTYRSPRIRSSNTHGTGCTLAAAIACLLARGHRLREAVPLAKRYINAAISAAPGLGHGHGPLNHFPQK